MSSITACVKKHTTKTRQKDVLDTLKELQSQHLADNLSGNEAKLKAVTDALAEFQAERANIMTQVAAAIGARRAQSQPAPSASTPLSNPLEMTSANVPKFKTRAEVDAFKTSLREQGYDGVYLTDKQQSFSLDQQAVSGETVATVVADLKSFLGTGYDNLVKAGKLEVVQSTDDAKATGIPMRGATGRVAGIYNPKLKKVVLVADNISQGDGRYVMTHEGAHALLREDPVFMKQRSKILADFLALAETSESVRAAIARVPSKTDPKVKDEEALAHWLQDRKNYEATEPKDVVEKLTALYKRLVSAVKSALFRAGLPYGRLTEMELAQIFTGGVQAWSMRAGDGASARWEASLLSAQQAARSIFSKLEQVAKINFTGMKAQGVLNLLNKQGVKKAEIEATGLDSWLAGMKPTDKVSRDDLMNFVQANMVEVEDVVLGEGSDYVLDDEGNRIDDGMGGFVTRQNRAAFKDYTEPNADPGSYREMFVTAPTRQQKTQNYSQLREEYNAFWENAYEKYGVEPNWPQEVLDENERYKQRLGNEYADNWEAIEGWQDGHSQYNEIRNPIVRVRYNTETRDGKTYLRIEEMQGPSDANQQKMPAYLRDNIYNIGSKRIIAMAKEMGVDGIVFAQKPGRSAGETQADRYSLEKKIERIEWFHKEGDAKGTLVAVEKNGNGNIDEYIAPEKLPEYIGKDATQKLLSQPVINGKKRVLTNQDLTIGGEGIKRLYDTQLPAMLESYAKSKFTDGILPITDKTPGSFPLFSQSQVFSTFDDTLKSGQERITQAVTALANPKSTLRGLYVQHAPKWLAVTPLRTLVQTFGKTIPQVKSFAEHLDAVVSTKTAIVDDAKVLYDKAKELAEKGPGLQAFNWAAAVASFNRMTPWLPMLEQDWVDQSKPKGEALIAARQKWIDAGMKKATGKTFDAAYKQAADLYNGLGNNGVKEAYQHIVDHLGVLRNREKNNLLAYIEKVSKDNPELRKELMARFNTSFSTLNGAYWPLSRVGDFRLEYTDSEGFRTVKHYTTLAERRADMAELTEQGAKDFMESFKDKRPRSEVAIPSMLMDQLSGAVLEKYLDGVDQADESQVANARAAAQDVIDDMNQIWLRWQPETSALANSIRRGNVKGFHEDSLRSYLDYTSRHASNIAWTEQGRKIEADLAGFSEGISKAAKKPGSDTTLDKMILNDLRARVNALRTVQVGAVASVLGKVSTAYYMTSPSIALVQMSQLGVLTLPKLAVKYGAVRAGKALASGIKEAFTKKFTRDKMFADAAVNIAYEDLHRVVTAENRDLPEAAGKELGDDLYSEQDKLRKIAQLTPYQKKLLVLRESMAKNLLDISAAHEAYELTQGKNPDSPMAKAFRYAMLPMSLSELASRKATILSTYELANAEGKNFFAAMGDIGDVVNDTLYSYAKENKPVALQGGVARVLAQFQWYRIMTAIRLAQLFNNSIRGESPEVKAAARKEFAGIMGMTTLLAGVLGTPLSMVFSALSLFSDEDEPEDYELLFQNWLRDTLGETGANVVAKGLPTLAGTDLSKRLGLSDIYGMQGEAPAEKHGRDLAAWYAGSLIGGPIFSIWSNAFQAYDEMVNKGNYMRGLETAMPKPIKDAMKAYRLGAEGLKTGAGKKLLADEKIGPDELIMQALGFSPDEVAAAQSANTSLTRLSTAISERRGRLIRDAAKAVIAGDRGDTLEAIRAWNAKNPRFAIRGQDIRPAIKKMIRGEMGVTGVRERAVAEVYEVPVYAE